MRLEKKEPTTDDNKHKNKETSIQQNRETEESFKTDKEIPNLYTKDQKKKLKYETNNKTLEGLRHYTIDSN